MKRIFLLVAVLIVAIAVVQAVPPVPALTGINPFRSERPLVISNGGGRGLFPENTLFAFQSSIDLGADILEMDIRMTLDGHLVTHHDETVERTSDGKGAILALTLSELKDLNFGARFVDQNGDAPYGDTGIQIATLDEVFRAFPETPMILELMDEGIYGKLALEKAAALIERYHRGERTLVQSAEGDLMDTLHTDYPDLLSSPGESDVRRWALLHSLYLDTLYRTRDQVLQIPTSLAAFDLTLPTLVTAAHRRNMAVFYETINDTATMLELLAGGADGIVTDRPDLLIRVLETTHPE